MNFERFLECPGTWTLHIRLCVFSIGNRYTSGICLARNMGHLRFSYLSGRYSDDGMGFIGTYHYRIYKIQNYKKKKMERRVGTHNEKYVSLETRTEREQKFKNTNFAMDKRDT